MEVILTDSKNKSLCLYRHNHRSRDGKTAFFHLINIFCRKPLCFVNCGCITNSVEVCTLRKERGSLFFNQGASKCFILSKGRYAKGILLINKM